MKSSYFPILFSLEKKAAKYTLLGLVFCLWILSFFFVGIGPAFPIKSKIKAGQKVDITTLDEGRFRVAAKNFTGALQLKLDLPDPSKARHLLVRRGYDPYGGKYVDKLRIKVAQTSHEVTGPELTFSPRTIIPLPRLNTSSLEISIENLDKTPSQLIIDEIGVYEKSPNRFSFLNFTHLKFAVKILRIAVSLLGLFLIARLGAQGAGIYGSLYVFSLGLLTFSSIVFVKFSPEWARDLKTSFASGALQEGIDHNCHYGLYMAMSILEGNGPLIDGAPPWCRMPGYGYLLSLLYSHPSYALDDLVQAAVSGVWFHIIFMIGSLTFFFWAFSRIASPLAAAAAVTGILLLPISVIFLMVIESLIPAVAILCLACSSLFLWQYYKNEERQVPFAFHLLLHLSFAFWFSLRTDILPAWFLVSLFLYCRQIRTLKYLLIPLLLVLSIGLPWGYFKMVHTGVFSMTTESVGASFMGGLWEVPHKFIWKPLDTSYYSWVESFGFDYKTKAASDFAVRECFRFCGTYPIYLISLIWHKFMIFLNIDHMAIPILFLLTIPVISFFIKYRRMQALLLGWMVFFNMPIFFIFYSSGSRFYDPAFIGLIVMGCAFLFDSQFFILVKKNGKSVASIAIIALGILILGERFDTFLIKEDKLRYWAPFLDPAKSSLSKEKDAF